MALYESILASPYRTLNGEEADFFFVPVLDSCIITRADDAPHLSMQVCLVTVKICEISQLYLFFSFFLFFNSLSFPIGSVDDVFGV